MDVKFRYIFEKKGAVAPENLLRNNLWIDVGNTERDGIFDHHQDGGFQSAFECVMRRYDCYEGIHSYLNSDPKNPEVVLHVHENPDLDCIFSIYVIQRMVRAGENNPAMIFDQKITELLIDYVNKIDSGLGKCMSSVTLYAYVCKIGTGVEDIQKRSQEIIDEGLRLLELVVDKLEDATVDINLFESPLEEYIDVNKLKYYLDAKRELQINRNHYYYDKNESLVIIKSVNLWNTSDCLMEPVKAAIWSEVPSGEDEYVFAREEDNCILTVYPYKIREESSIDGVTRVIIALNPNIVDSQKFSLLPLAEMLEQCEQIEEELLYEQTRRYRRDHSRSREDGRFSDIPFYVTSDPWYISEKEDIIDSPRIDSLLPYNRILSIIENGSSMIKKASVLDYNKDGDQIKLGRAYDSGEISFGELYKKTRDMIRKLKDNKDIKHLFAFVKIDPSMLRYSNNMLKACCFNIVGKSDSNFSKDNFLQIDYRTCLYTDQSITILVAIDRRNQSLGSLVYEEKLEESQICKDLKNILEQQSELRSIGVCLSDTIQKITQESGEIDRFNERLVKLNTRIEEDDLIVDPIEQEVYAFIKNTLNIESLKNSVITSAQLLIKNAEQLRDRKAAEDRQAQEEREKKEEQQEAKRDNRIQAGIGLVTIFAIFSAWVDAFDFFAKFIPGQEGGWTGVVSCRPVFIIEIAVTVFILCLGCVACTYVIQALLSSSDKKADKKADKKESIDNLN